jgi:AcrR family transcriptional regulator
MTSSPSRTYDASGRQAAARERRLRVIEAAHELFLADGYGPTSIAAIARASGVSAPFVYATFGSKAGVLGAVVDVAVGGDDEDILVRDRADALAVLEAPDGATFIRLGAAHTRAMLERSGGILHLVASVAGSDAAVGELHDKLVEARRNDNASTIRLLPGMRADLTHEDLVATVDALTNWETWWTLVELGGWSPERYEAWVVDVASAYLLA